MVQCALAYFTLLHISHPNVHNIRIHQKKDSVAILSSAPNGQYPQKL